MNERAPKPIMPTAACAALLVLFATAIPAAEPVIAETITVTAQQEFKRLPHEFELQTGEKLVLAHSREARPFRVCVADFKGAVPLKVVADDKVSEVFASTCETVTARHLSVEPGEKLPGGTHLIGRYGKIRR